MNITEAIRLEESRQFEAAAKIYEAVLADDPNSVKALVNLTVLYWQATDLGFSAGHALAPDFVKRAGDRLHALLNDANVSAPAPVEMQFWKKYIAWADLAEPLSLAFCRDLLQAHPLYLEPAMFIHLQTEGAECQAEAEQLVRQCATEGSVRNSYIQSILSSVTKRRNFAQKQRPE